MAEASRPAAHGTRHLCRGRLGHGARTRRCRAEAGARAARGRRHLRRLARLGLGRSNASRRLAAEALPVQRRRLRRQERQLQLRHCDVPAAARRRHCRSGDGPRDRLDERLRPYAPHGCVRRARAQERASLVRRPRRAWHGDVAAPCQGCRHRIRRREPEPRRCPRFPARALDLDPAWNRYGVSARHRRTCW